MRHRLGVEHLVRLRLGEVAGVDGGLADALALFQRGLRDLRGLVVADRGVERGRERHRLLDARLAVLLVGLQLRDEPLAERLGGVRQQRRRFEEVVCDDGLVEVQVDLAARGAGRDRGVVADDLLVDLVDRLGDDGVDLPGHDRGAGLVLGLLDLAEPVARAGGEEAEVVGHLVHAARDRAERAVRLGHRVVGGLRLEVVLRLAERRPGLVGDVLGGELRELGVGVEAGPDRGAAEGELAEVRLNALGALDPLRGLGAVAAELLPEPDGGRVLEVRPAGLDDAVERRLLRLQLGVERFERRHEVLLDGLERRDVHRGRDHVVRGLPVVDVVVRVDDPVADLRARDLGGAVGDDLVGVHVRGGARAGLEHVDGELVVVLARDDLVGGGDDRVGGVVVDEVQVAVRLRGRLLDDAERADEPPAHRDPRDREVLDGALGLRAPVGVRRHLHLAEAVLLRAVVFAHTCAFPRDRVKATGSGHGSRRTGSRFRSNSSLTQTRTRASAARR
ncbi:30S ribosomal protein S5 [Halorubrum kocurii JCM 14978]|uniref:30S ribosomal protein S5 n=1 Tax=Halorubrum kocurii JCM 14978 TaxID=1230456 RepID=M0P7M0_9EURY|nr:30S ribosomal protein S5 [Halorubrum kocurii JCM 14978]